MINDIDVIERFKEEISWADKTQAVVVKCKDGERIILIRQAAIYLPTHWQEASAVARSIATWELAYTYKLPPMLLLYGEPPEEQVEKIWRESLGIKVTRGDLTLKLYTHFVDIEASFVQIDLVHNALEGIDWNRTFEKFVKRHPKENIKPVWEWE